VANILEEMGLETCGCCGTTACLALLNDAVKKGGVMASNHVGGLSGAFIPVSEDAGMIHAAEIGCLTIEKLEAMTAVCSVGIDMVIIPGDTTPAVISALIADEAAIGMVNSKTTAVRVIPAIGRKAGEVLDFGGLLGKLGQVAIRGHAQHLEPFRFNGLGQGTNTQTRGVFRAVVFVNDDDGETEFHGAAQGKEQKTKREVYGINVADFSRRHLVLPTSRPQSPVNVQRSSLSCLTQRFGGFWRGCLYLPSF
jgi:hypothetical protein